MQQVIQDFFLLFCFSFIISTFFKNSIYFQMFFLTIYKSYNFSLAIMRLSSFIAYFYGNLNLRIRTSKSLAAEARTCGEVWTTASQRTVSNNSWLLGLALKKG